MDPALSTFRNTAECLWFHGSEMGEDNTNWLPMFLCLGLVFSSGDYLCFLLARSLHCDEGPGPKLAQNNQYALLFSRQ